MRKMIAALADLVPGRVKQTIVGSPSHPSLAANAIGAVLNWIPGERYPCLTCSGILRGYRMRVDWSRYRAYAYGTWEIDVVNAVKQIVREGFVAIDIGAHHGFYALILSRLVGPSGRVIAFEAINSNFQILKENIALNNCSNVESVNMAVSDKSGCLTASRRLKNDSGSFTQFPNQGASSVSVAAVSLDDFLAGYDRHVDFIEIDVEGAESLVLKGAGKTLESCHPVLLIEVHHFGSSLSSSPVPRLLEEIGYDLQWLLKWDETSHLLATWKGAT